MTTAASPGADAPSALTAAFANVAVNTSLPARAPFTYAVPAGMALEPGQAVFVPFGPRILHGIVVDLADVSAIESPRPIEAVADPHPVLDAAHIALARWMSDYYVAPLWDCIAACLPSGYGQKSVTMVSPVDIPPLLPVYPRDQQVLSHLAEHGRSTVEALRDAVPGVTLPRLQRLQENGFLTVAQGLARPTGRPRMERRIAPSKPAADLVDEAERLRSRTPKSIAARLLTALSGGEVTLAEAHSLGATTTHIRSLEAAGWLREHQVRMLRDPLAGFAFSTAPALLLTAEQLAAADAIAAAPGQVHLLHGVTGSGKTEVYLDLVRRTLAAGRSAIVLVPEIGLTPQAIRRYGERFSETLTVLHSRLGTGELFDQWYRIESGEARLVLGSRSALFAPVKDLGLVVLDEEHEWTYKQTDRQPRYHARETARELARLTGATLVLGSATPAITTYYQTQSGAASLHTLADRVAPQGDGSTVVGRHALVRVVDMREELRAGNRSVFSFPLKRAVRAALEAGEQSILFVNRRGAARFVLCRACGFVPQCPSCKVPVSLDATNPLQPALRCHHCGRSRRMEERCPACDSNKYRPFGVGTQRIEHEARLQFPGSRVARWDSDTASRKGSHEEIVRALEAREIDILVGTQILAKGLDLPEMTVVGVVDADVGLSLPDYHAGERAFELLSQVAGRAGRRDKPGFVFFQTYDPEAMPIRCAAEHDYTAFYDSEIAHRRRAGYPPFTRLARLLYRDPNNEHALQETTRVAEAIRLARDAAGRPDPEVLGPNPSYIARLRGDYRWQIVLRCRDPAAAVRDLRLGERWAVDIDPASLL